MSIRVPDVVVGASKRADGQISTGLSPSLPLLPCRSFVWRTINTDSLSVTLLVGTIRHVRIVQRMHAVIDGLVLALRDTIARKQARIGKGWVRVDAQFYQFSFENSRINSLGRENVSLISGEF